MDSKSGARDIPAGRDTTTQPLLASAGGASAFPAGPPRWPLPDLDVQAALQQAWADGTWGAYHSGACDTLCSHLATLTGTTHAYPVCSGTFATELALRMLQIGPGDEVLLAAYDFPGNFRAIEAVGARPVLVDVQPDTWQIDLAQCAAAASPAVKGVVISHLHGTFAPVAEIAALARAHNWFVVEDACQTPGGLVSGKPTGSWGDVGTLSFGGSKLLTAGRGGAVVTANAQWLQRAKVFCEQGNHAYPLSSLQAAVLNPQLHSLTRRNEQRLRAVRLIAAAYREGFAPHESPPLLPVLYDHPESSCVYYKFAWRLLSRPGESLASLAERREAISRAARAEGLAFDPGFASFVTRSARRCRRVGELPHASLAAVSTLLLHHPVLLEPDDVLLRVAQTLVALARHHSCS